MEMIKGADISTLISVEQNGGHFFDGGVEKDCLQILKDYGFNYVRIRLWNDPKSSDGRAYGAGDNDADMLLRLASRAKAAGLKILLDFHYSDFWADPGKQYMPKAWTAQATVESLTKHVYDYTREIVSEMIGRGLRPDMVQIGNELSNGLLWPLGKVPEYDNIARFVSAGLDAVRELDPSIKLMIHLDNGGKNSLYREWFDNFTKRGSDFDIIGLSYYPFWHGSFDDLSANMNDIALRYGKELVIAEVSTGFTMEDYASFERLAPHERKGYATKPSLVEKVEYPMTPEGQCGFMKRLADVIRAVPGGLGRGFFYWEPAWIPVPNVWWATPAALEYIHEPGPGGNEWANQALFTYAGHALPALATIRDL
ncbi:MAG: glycosyl hydrolase 53 family protein [Lachnospiraceae bacterium]|nr:glycosyl hydrolase 53 family protein [Lachnospiraceae bacterium]